MSSEPVLDLRAVFGVQARITAPATATGGACVEMECTAAPGSGTMVHYHPNQEETFQVIEGTLEIRGDGRWVPLRPGERYAVPRGATHAWRNSGQGPVRFRNVHRPAFRFQEHLECLDRLARAGKIRGTRDLRSLIYMSMSAAEYRPDVTVKPPQWMVTFLAFVGRRLGYTLT